jgi:hypothetical protein
VVEALVSDYEDAQLFALKAGLLAAAGLAIVALGTTGSLPSERPAARAVPPAGPRTDGPGQGGRHRRGRRHR